jgi:putative heme-binding domain-containing protein
MLVFSFLALFAAMPIFAQGGQSGGPNDAGRNQGAQLYASNCAYCHGADGKGGRGPAIATMPKVIALSDTDLAGIVHNGEADQGMPSFPDLGDQGTQAVVRYLRMLQGVTGAPPPTQVTGDANAGRVLFFGKGQCSSCHMISGEGGFIASDMTAYGQNRAASDILQAIVNPDRNLAPTSRVVEVRTKAGQSLTGAVRSEDNMNITLQTEDGRYHFLARSSLAAVNYTDHSLMPHDYGTRLTAKELDDLVSFLIVTGKNAPAEPAPTGRRRHGGN